MAKPQHKKKGPEIVKLLLDYGADAAARDGGGQTALDLALERGRDDIADLLQRAGAG